MRLTLASMFALAALTAAASAQQGYGPGFSGQPAPYVHPSFQAPTNPYAGSSSSSQSQQSGYPGGQGGTYPYGMQSTGKTSEPTRRPFGTTGSKDGRY